LIVFKEEREELLELQGGVMNKIVEALKKAISDSESGTRSPPGTTLLPLIATSKYHCCMSLASLPDERLLAKLRQGVRSGKAAKPATRRVWAAKRRAENKAQAAVIINKRIAENRAQYPELYARIREEWYESVTGHPWPRELEVDPHAVLVEIGIAEDISAGRETT